MRRDVNEPSGPAVHADLFGKLFVGGQELGSDLSQRVEFSASGSVSSNCNITKHHYIERDDNVNNNFC